ncbi:T9SS type A sorting domain-containing protein [Flavobacterium sp.]|uniref:poly(ethylene terephthalate) hydrolase family protein n=1 Tax=Flavobacterium sp. TaxID=239 RepID=UPI0024895FC5|nr:T9SS type A sorting domain-containing protein [Flavobacterium sp.]MDI1317025.1 T9SS type A sorting domain-containing protein [Flavobacterium sp.]
MKKSVLFFLIITFCSATTWAQSFVVGHKQQTFVDASRSNRNITAEIYYPANTAGDNVSIASGQFPVLIFGHGFVMTWSAYAPEWNAIVPNGYIMVFPTTETGFLPSHTNFGKDMAYLVGAMKTEGTTASSTFFGAVAATSAVMGHSMGGGSAFLAVQYDSSITALATLAAANTNPSSITAAAGISIPSIVISGANDCVAPPNQHQIPMYTALASACKTFVSITGGSHCQFANSNINCSIGEATCSPQPAISSSAQQNTTITVLVPWLNHYLKNDTAAGVQFQNVITAANGITSQQNCSLLTTTIANEVTQSTITIFPNPFSSATTLQTNVTLVSATLTVYSIYGETVVRRNAINGQSVVLSRENLASGVYFVRITEGNKIIATSKLVIAN